jgi:DNA-binding GntR family transcriptional regulator
VETLARVNLREQAGRVIRASILGGDLAPGEIYSAAILADRLGVSPTPVREAMLDLANAGLVEPVRNRGFRVLTVEDEDLDEITELRVMLEVPALAMVIERASDEDLEAIERRLMACDRAAVAGDIPAFLLADREFHLGLLGLSGNRRLVHLVGQLRDQTQLVGIRNLADAGKLAATAREHRPIVEAVRARDADAAQALMRAHLRHTRGSWAGRREPDDLPG